MKPIPYAIISRSTDFSRIIGELAFGNIKNCKEILSLLQEILISPAVEFPEYLYFIEQNKLSDKGIGLVDIHLLASAKLGRATLWTANKRLEVAATKLGLNYKIKRNQ
ncbi:[similarity to] PilT protein domain-containing protein [methanotrophic bacterial endosymbiont of Bathymodiolus sp.]|nr:[similarity to] PilT protein domain-containing protein [methanotrophic bacterial endosymbiont of Bathymodiolus sp.]